MTRCASISMDDDDDNGVPPLLRDVRGELSRVYENKRVHGPGTRFAVEGANERATKEKDAGWGKEASIMRASETNALMSLDVVRRRAPAVNFSAPSQRHATRETPERVDGDTLVLHVEKSLKAIEAKPRGTLSFEKLSSSSSSSQTRRPATSEEGHHAPLPSEVNESSRRRRKTHYLGELDVAAAYAQTLPRKAVATLYSCTSRFGKEALQGNAGRKESDASSKTETWDKSDMATTIDRDGDKLLSSRRRTASFSFRSGDDSRKTLQCVRLQTELNPKFDAVRPKPTSCIIARSNEKRDAAEHRTRLARSRTTCSPGPGSYEVEPAKRNTARYKEQWKLSSRSTRTHARRDHVLREARKSDINPINAQMRLKKKTPSYTFSPLKTTVPSEARTRDETLGPRNVAAEVILQKGNGSERSTLSVNRPAAIEVRFAIVERRVRGGSWAPSMVHGVRGQHSQYWEKARATEKGDTKRASCGASSVTCESNSCATLRSERLSSKEVTLPSSTAWSFSRAPRELSKSSSKSSSYRTSEARAALQGEPGFAGVVDISIVRPRSRAVRFSPFLDENDDDATVICEDDSLFRTLRKIFLRRRRRKSSHGSGASEALDILDTTSAWNHLQRHVPAAAWSIGAERWREQRGLCAGDAADPQRFHANIGNIQDCVCELAASIKLTHPSSPVCIINPLPTTASQQLKLRRTHAEHERSLSFFYDAVNLDIVRPRTAHRATSGAPSFAKQLGRNLQPNSEDACSLAHVIRGNAQQQHADIRSYEPSYAAVEPRVKGALVFERQQSRFDDECFANRESGTNEDIPVVEGDILSLDTISAKDFTLRNLRDPVAAQFVQPSVFEPCVSHPESSDMRTALGDVRQMFAASVAHGGDSCIRPRIRAAGVVDMNRQTQRPLGIVIDDDHSESNEKDNGANEGPGMYRAFENWTEMRPSAPAWTFSRDGMSEDVNAPCHGRILEGDILHIDPESALQATSLYARSTSAYILPEHTHHYREGTAVTDGDETEVEKSGPTVDYYDADKPRRRQPSFVDYSRMLPRPPLVRDSQVDNRLIFCEDKDIGVTQFTEEAARLSSWPPLAPSNSGFTFAKADVSRPLTQQPADLRADLDVNAADALVRPDHLHGSHRRDTIQPLGLHIGHSDAKDLEKDRLTSWVPFLDTNYDENLRHHVATHTYTAQHHDPANASSGFDVDIGGIDAGCYDPFIHMGGTGNKMIRWGYRPEKPENKEHMSHTKHVKERLLTTRASEKADAAFSSMRMSGEVKRIDIDTTRTLQSPQMTQSKRQKMLQNALARVERSER